MRTAQNVTDDPLRFHRNTLVVLQWLSDMQLEETADLLSATTGIALPQRNTEKNGTTRCGDIDDGWKFEGANDDFLPEGSILCNAVDNYFEDFECRKRRRDAEKHSVSVETPETWLTRLPDADAFPPFFECTSLKNATKTNPLCIRIISLKELDPGRAACAFAIGNAGGEVVLFSTILDREEGEVKLLQSHTIYLDSYVTHLTDVFRIIEVETASNCETTFAFFAGCTSGSIFEVRGRLVTSKDEIAEVAKENSTAFDMVSRTLIMSMDSRVTVLELGPSDPALDGSFESLLLVGSKNGIVKITALQIPPDSLCRIVSVRELALSRNAELEAAAWLDAEQFVVAKSNSAQLEIYKVSPVEVDHISEQEPKFLVKKINHVCLNANGDDYVSFAVLSLATHGGRYILVCTDVSKLILIDAISGTHIRCFYSAQNDSYAVGQCGFIDDGANVLASSTSYMAPLSIWETKTQSKVGKLRHGTVAVRSFAVHGDLILTVGYDKQLVIFSRQP